jgi:hypothetical protein
MPTAIQVARQALYCLSHSDSHQFYLAYKGDKCCSFHFFFQFDITKVSMVWFTEEITFKVTSVVNQVWNIDLIYPTAYPVRMLQRYPASFPSTGSAATEP